MVELFYEIWTLVSLVFILPPSFIFSVHIMYSWFSGSVWHDLLDE